MTSFGIPVIVAGEAWIRSKGITTDVSSPEHYETILRGLPLGRRLPPETVARARRYAYHFIFRRMVPLGVIESASTAWAPFEPRIAGLDDLAPGRDLGLDVICDGILRGTPFIHPAEHRVAPASARVASQSATPATKPAGTPAQSGV